MSARPLDMQQLNAFVDGELDLTRQLEVEALVAQDAHWRSEVAQLRQLRDMVREQADYHRVPPALKERLHALASPGMNRVAARVKPRGSGWQPAAWSFALTCMLALGVGSAWWRAGQDDRLVQEAIADHVRATLSQRLVDVASSDQHTVKPWLSSRLDYSPPVRVPQWPALVFVGGRVDYLDGRPTATLVYRLRAHVIDVFVAPSTQGEQPPRIASQRGFNVVQQVRGGMRTWAVSDLNADELAAFVRALDAADGSH